MANGLRKATSTDISAILDLAEANLADYQRYQATFWRRSGGPRDQQAVYLETHIASENALGYVHAADGVVDGFVIGSVLAAPPVYQPGGPVALIEDLAFRHPAEWLTAGSALLDLAISEAREKGAVLAAVVAGREDESKRFLLKRMGFSPASEWHLRQLAAEDTRQIKGGSVRPAVIGDLPALLELADQRRVAYQAFQPIFWRNAPAAREWQRPSLPASKPTRMFHRFWTSPKQAWANRIIR